MTTPKPRRPGHKPTARPVFESMHLDDLAAWVTANNEVDGEVAYDDLPATDELDDDEAAAAHDEYVCIAHTLADLHGLA